jgi:hypothetical protein
LHCVLDTFHQFLEPAAAYGGVFGQQIAAQVTKYGLPGLLILDG